VAATARAQMSSQYAHHCASPLCHSPAKSLSQRGEGVVGDSAVDGEVVFDASSSLLSLSSSLSSAAALATPAPRVRPRRRRRRRMVGDFVVGGKVVVAGVRSCLHGQYRATA